MFESAVSYLLNRILGKYVQNLDSSNLNVSIWNGDVELTDLQLRPEALVELRLPIEVKAGYVGHMKADIPWTSLFSASVVVQLEDVYVLAGPITDREYDPERERVLQNAIKRELLESLGASTISKVADSAGEDPGFFEKLYTYVVNNIQLSIGRVHVRYEDTVTNPDHPFACGLMLKHISAYTTDARWQPAQMDNTATVIHKLMEMSELSVYWNPYIPEQHLVRSRLNSNGWRSLLKKSILEHRIFDEDFDFIIQPVSAESKLFIGKDDNVSIPKFFADLCLKEIDVMLSRQQFLSILSLQDSFALMSVNQKYRKYHPNVPLKISPRSWWMYAYTAVVEERIRPYSWERIKEHRTKYRKYKELYKRSLGSASHDKSRLLELEEGLDACNIVIAREHAKSEFAPEKVKKREKPSTGWFSGWFGAGPEVEEEEMEVEIQDPNDFMSMLSPEEKAKLYQGIGYAKNTRVATHPKEYVEYKVQVNLASCSLSLVNYSKKILQVSVTQMLGSFETRPAGDAFRVSCKTESFSIDGASIEHDLVPIVTSDVNVYAPSVNQILTLDFESNPMYVDADFSLKTNIQPIEVVYDEHSLCEVRAFFQLPTGNVDVRTAAMTTLQEVAKISQAGLIYAIQQHKTVHVAVNMKSPYIVIPEFGTLHRGGNVLIADLGMLQIKSELQPKNQTLEQGNLSESEISAQLYDQFNITIADVKVLLADSGDDWHTAQVQPTSEYHLLPSTKLDVEFYNTVKPDYKQLPQQKVITTLPTFELNISDKRLLLLWKFFRHFPLPTSTSIGMMGEDMVDGGMADSYSYVLDLAEVQADPGVDSLRSMKRSVLGRRIINKNKRQENVSPASVLDEADNAYLEDDDTEIWSKYEEVQPVDDISSPSNTTNIVVRVVVREVVVQLSRSLDGQEREYLMFRADRLRLNATFTEFGHAAHASLGALQLVDKIHVGVSGEYLELLSTKAGTDLVSVLYRKVDEECLDFSEVYKNVEVGVRLDFQTLNIVFDQGAIMYLRAYVEGLLSSMYSNEMITSASTIVSSVVPDPADPASQPRSVVEDSTDHTDPTHPDLVQLNVIARLHDLSLTLADNNSRVAEIHIRDLQGHAIMRPERLAVTGHLKDINIKDTSHGALYPNILILEEEEDSLFKYTFVRETQGRRSPGPDNRREQQFDYTVNLRVGHLQCVALGRFYWELTKFFEPFLSPEVRESASNAMETVSKQVGGFQSENKRFGITLNMMSPTIVLPRQSASYDLILLRSGDLHVHNMFDTTDLGGGVKQNWNHVYVVLEDMQLHRARLSEEDNEFHEISRILEKMTFQTDLRLILEPEVSPVQTDVSAKLERIQGALSQRDTQVFMGVLRENWAEGAPQPGPDYPVRQPVLTHQPSADSGTVVMETPMSETKPPCTAILFTMDGMELTLYQDIEDDDAQQLAVLNMGKISGKVNSPGDGETKVTVALETISITDTRSDCNFAFKKILYYDEESINKLSDSRRPLVSVIYKMSSDGNQKADVMMERVIVNVHFAYILQLSAFFTEAFVPPAPPDAPAGLPPLQGPGDQSGPQFTVYCSVKQPEIVLFADPASTSSRILVANADIAFEYTASPSQQKMWSKVTGLKMFASMYEAPSSHSSKMISPCDLEFTRSYNLDQNKLHMEANMAALYLHLTPTTLRLVLDVAELMKQADVQTPEPEMADDPTNTPTDLWHVKAVSATKWIDKANDSDYKQPNFGSIEPPVETVTVAIREVCAFFELENLDQTVPLLCVRTSLVGRASNWTKDLRMSVELELDICYYNERLSVWEPLIEPTLEQEGIYKPWNLRAQMFQAQSYPIVCSYDDNGLDFPDGLQNDVDQMIGRKSLYSSSSENDADDEVDSPSGMTILRPKIPKRRIRIASDQSYESIGRNSSVQGESDSESEALIHTITNKLGSIFSSDSSDADISETDDNEDTFDPVLDKPIFLTPRGPIRFRSGPGAYDEPDGIVPDPPEPEDKGSYCTYTILSSREKLQVNVTQPAIAVIRDVLEGYTSSSQAMGQTGSENLKAVKKLPALEIHNKLGVEAEVVLHSIVKVHPDFVHGCTVCHPGDLRNTAPPIIDENIITEEEEDEDEDTLSSQRRPLTFINQALADVGHSLVSAGGFVFDDDIMTGTQFDRDSIQIRVAGFDPVATCYMNRACHKLLPLTPKQHSTKYHMVYDVDMNHSHKTVSIHSPLQLTNNLAMPVDVFVKRSELQHFKRSSKSSLTDEYTKLTTLEPGCPSCLPLYAAYHCALYVCPASLPYERSSEAIWWPDVVQAKERARFVSCPPTDAGGKVLHIKVVCGEPEPLNPPQSVSRTTPYMTLSLHPPVVLHNYLPYDVQFSLEGSVSSSSLTHGESTPLYTVDIDTAYKLNLFVADYLSCDWRGTFDITKEMDEFKAISMDTDVDPDDNNKHLSLSVHFNLTDTWNLYIYSPYWIVNKTDLKFRIRGSMSDSVLECDTSNYPKLFRYKKNKRKKAKLKVYDSHWSHSFSLDTVGNYGVVECCDTQRKCKYTFLVQSQLSRLKLTKIITVTPFFLVVNRSGRPLRYMEHNKHTDLWFDLDVGQCCPFWPVTDSYKLMVKYEGSNIVSQHFPPFWPVTDSYKLMVKYEGSNIVSQHFPFRRPHNTVLRMEHGTALSVSVTGGCQTPITVQFTDYNVGDAPVRVENFCDDVFIKIHQKNQSQTTVLASNESLLYTWDMPTAERTLMWNVYGKGKPDFPASINKDGYGCVNLKLKSLKLIGTLDYVDGPEPSDSSADDDESDEPDGLIGHLNKSLLGRTRSDKLVVFWVSYLDNHQRVLLFSQDERVAKGARKAHVQGIDIPHERGVMKMDEAEQTTNVVFISLDGLSVSVINGAYREVALLSVSSLPAVWEVEVNNRWKILNMELQTWLEDQWRNGEVHSSLMEQLEANLDEMQMLKPYMGALRRTYNPGLWFNYRTSQHHMSVHAKIQRIQLDNQLSDAYFATVLYPSPTPVYVVKKKGQKPFMELGFVRRTVPENNVDTFRYFKLLVQEFNIRLDKGFMMSLYDVFSHLMADDESESAQLQSDLLLTQRSLQDVAAVISEDRPQRMFFEYLRLSPLKMHVSFSLNGTSHVTQRHRTTIVSDVVDFFLSSVGATLTEMRDVELRMAFFEVKGSSLSWAQLTSEIQAHYTHQAIQQAYVLILGLDVLGNPYGLVKDFTQGLGDLFYEPFLDSVQGSDEFAVSLMRGVHSMLGNTVGGTAGSVARITGSLGSALAALSLDQTYRNKRRATMQQRPTSLPRTIILAGQGFAMGVVFGLSGVILDPVRGAKEEGVEGFFKGVGKGIMGLLTKPTGGVFDMVSMAFDGLQRAAELEHGVVHRMRKPRFINSYLGVRPYSSYQADGYNLLLTLNKGQYAVSDTYWAHAPLIPEMLFITDRHVLMLRKRRCWGSWEVDWDVKVDDILGVPAIVANKLVFKVRQDERSVNVFAGEDQEITSSEPDLLRWIQKRMENLVKYRQR